MSVFKSFFLISIVITFMYFLESLDLTFIPGYTLYNLTIIVCTIITLIFSLGNYYNKKIKKSTTVAQWTVNLEGSSDLFSYYFKSVESKDVISNMELIKERILLSVDNKKDKLRLLRAYLKTISDDKITRLYFNLLGTTGIGIFIFVIQNSLKENPNNGLSLMNIEMHWGLWISLFIVSAAFLFIPHGNDYRTNIIINIIDECLEEEESDSSK